MKGMAHLLPLTVFFLFSAVALAKEAEHIVSPEVQADGRVTFRFADPNALKVELSIEGQAAPTPMQKDESGIWSATVGPLPPDFYGYNFKADGVDLVDPSNTTLKPNLLNLSNEVHIPDPSLPWEVADVPHGQIHQHFYRSKIAGEDRDYYVYTPPKYDPKKKTEYPVLYLLHGFSEIGRAHV